MPVSSRESAGPLQVHISELCGRNPRLPLSVVDFVRSAPVCDQRSPRAIPVGRRGGSHRRGSHARARQVEELIETGGIELRPSTLPHERHCLLH